MVHVHDETPSRILNRYRREALALKQIFPHERFNLFDFLRLSAGNIISDSFRASQEGKLMSHLWSIFVFRLMQFWGTYRGFAKRGPISEQLAQTFFYPNGWDRPASDTKDRGGRQRVDYSRSLEP